MFVYYIAEHIITDPVQFEEYRVKVASWSIRRRGI